MHHHYEDIIRVAGLAHEHPRWWDENGVPRFCDFHPQASGYVYASEAVLLLIACQSCLTTFPVCMTDGMFDFHRGTPKLSAQVEDSEIHYGDPPNTGCCAAGPTMNSIPVRVLEFWRRFRGEWERVADLERTIACDWMPVDEHEALVESSRALSERRDGEDAP